MLLEQLDILLQNNNNNKPQPKHHTILYTKINSKYIINLNVKKWNYKDFGKKHKRKSSWPGSCQRVPRCYTRSMIYKRKIVSCTTSKLKLLKDTVKRMKRQAIEWDKIFANHIFGKILVPKYRKSPHNTRVRKQKTQLKNGQKT